MWMWLRFGVEIWVQNVMEGWIRGVVDARILLCSSACLPGNSYDDMVAHAT